uniref:Transthyretin-like family protein n=1 Tax=Caenorhabditis tropicalis TaxID=1561998 RepID=A0A1I7UMD8_9PELO
MFFKVTLLLLSLFALSYGLGGIVGRGQKVTVVGKLVCNGQPAKDVKVKLYEDGTIYDTKMDTMNTLGDGTFSVNGSQKKIRKIDPKINIYHRCNHHGLCPKKVIIHVPKNAVGKGTKEAQLFDIGTLNLANKFPGETTDCIH